MSNVIGIDLGTTNSCVAVFEHDAPRVIASRTGQRTIPSVVAITDSGKQLVGHLAKRQAITNPQNTVYGAKRLLGRRFDSPDIERLSRMVGFQFLQGPHGDVRVVLADTEYAVSEISSHVLRELRLIAEDYLKSSVSQAVVTVPAYFNDNQRQATKDAGRIAGLDIIRIINEPTAAALAYGFGRGFEQKMAVYDLGGGTFDISLLEIGQDVFEVLATGGDTFLGGDDFDERIIYWLLDGFQAEHGIDLRQDRMAMQRLRDAAEKAKIDLSELSATDINLPFVYSKGRSDSLHLQRLLTRETLVGLVDDLILKTIGICEQTLNEAGIGPSDLAAVVLVGGMARMPKVQALVRDFFGIGPSKGVHPDEVVACGAAIKAHLLVSGSQDTLLLDVTPHDLGVLVSSGRFEVLIKKGTAIPTSAQKVFTTIKDGQTQVRIVVLQGDAKDPGKRELLGEFVLSGLTSAPRGTVRVTVTFAISADGTVDVTAKDAETNHVQAIVINGSSSLTEQEIREMTTKHQDLVAQAGTQKGLDPRLAHIADLLTNIDTLMPRAENILQQTAFGGDALAKAKQAVERARQAVVHADVQAVDNIQESLERTLGLLKNIGPS